MSVANEEECHIMATEIFGIINLGYSAKVVEVEYGYLPSNMHVGFTVVEVEYGYIASNMHRALQVYLAGCKLGHVNAWLQVANRCMRVY